MREVKLRISTLELLEDMRSRREFHVGGHKHPKTGYWVMVHERVRTVTDYDRIANFRRAPKAIRKACQRIVDGMVGEARRFERMYGDRRS